jgi:glycogen(starch) synthase
MTRRRRDVRIILVGAYPPPFGGVQVHMESLKRHLEIRGHGCFVVNLGKNKNLWGPDIASPKNSLRTALMLLRFRRAVCHLHYGGTLHTRLILLTLFAGIVFRRRCAVTIHSGGLPVSGMPSGFRACMIRMSFNLQAKIICVNRQIAAYFEAMKVDGKRIEVIPPFDFNAHRSEAGDPPPAIQHFIRDKRMIICNIGLLEPEYELEMVLRVFKRFNRENPESGLILIGSGSLHEKLERLIDDTGLRGKAILSGDLDHGITLKILAACSCYVRATRYDGDCISLREALHLGVPAIAGDTGMRPEGAVLFTIGNEEELLSRLRDVTRQNRIAMNKAASGPCPLERVEAVLSELASGENPAAVGRAKTYKRRRFRPDRTGRPGANLFKSRAEKS